MGDSKEFFGGFVTFLVLLALGSWALRLTRTHRDTLRFQVRLFVAAMLLRFAAATAIYQFGIWAMLGDADASGWWFGDSLWRQWQASNFNGLDVLLAWTNAFRSLGGAGGGQLGTSTHVGYYYLLGTVFFWIGTSSRMITAAINCFIGSLIVVFAYRTARVLFSQWVATRVAWWSCLFPSMIIWSAQTVKEPVVILLEIVALYCCVRLKKSDFALRYVALSGFAVVLMLPFRFYASYISMAAFASVLLVPTSTAARRRTQWSAVGLLLFIGAIVVVGFTLANSEAKLDQYDLSFIQKFRHDIAEGAGSGVDLDVDMTTTTGFGIGTFVGAAHLLLAPFPWQLGGASLRMLLTTPELVYWWWLFFVGVVPGVRRAAREHIADLVPVFLFIAGLGLLYSMTFGNIGLVFRQRAQLLPWLFMFGAAGLEQRAHRATLRRAAILRTPTARVYVSAAGR